MKISFAGESNTDLFNSLHGLEWLETNGLGGWASSTVSGARSRRYHGLLIAALDPPVGRKVMLSALEESMVVGSEKYFLSCNQFPGALYPEGYRHLVSFEKDLFPVFIYRAGSIILKKTIAAIHGENTTVVTYEVLEADDSFVFELRPFYSARDFHSLSHANDFINRQYVFNNGVLQLKNYQDLPEIFISVRNATFIEDQHWYHNFEYSVEAYRGLDYKEDLYTHGILSLPLGRGGKVGVIISMNEPKRKDAFKLLEKERKRREKIIGTNIHPRVKQLALAADQFVVQRGSEGLKSIVAGYHWFSDWGRDTMIALPGICLTTERSLDAKKILKAFAGYVNEGMLPNRFPDQGEAPEYNTIDATFWFFVANYHYYRATRDKKWIRDMLPVLEEIIRWHRQGTRFDIHEDEDGLITGGAEGVQLTWMDAKIGDWVVTPRRGKAVEINALWYNSLRIIASFLLEIGKKSEAVIYEELSVRVLESFNHLFWNNERQYLSDYIDGDYRNDDLRPNQLFAISLPFPLLDKVKSERVLNVVSQSLVTTRGLRSLEPGHPDYKPTYGGDVWSRDSSYHQGTVWGFLIGPYVDALIYVHGDKGRQESIKIVLDFLQHLDEGCVGSISEIFDADRPHLPRGCVAQAWSVGEVLRVIHQYKLLDSPITNRQPSADVQVVLPPKREDEIKIR